MDLGVGVGFRVPHHTHVLKNHPPMDWFEVIGDNYVLEPPIPLQKLEALTAQYPVILHGVSLSIGSCDPLRWDYLRALKRLIARVNPPWVSDHLCFTGMHGIDSHDLLPLPYTAEALSHVVERARQVQDFLEVPFALENASSYLTYRDSTMPEWEFLGEVAERADVGILFDVNNVFVSAHNHGFDPHAYIDSIDPGRVVQLHLAGHTDKGTHLFDTHSTPVCDEVWELFRRTVRRVGATSTLIEWDQDIPPWDDLAREAAAARALRAGVLAEASPTRDLLSQPEAP